MALEVKGMHSSGTWLPATVESLTNQTILNDNGYIEYIPACGPVAQLGARFHGMEEVVGSIPTRSTNLNPPRIKSLSDHLREPYKQRRSGLEMLSVYTRHYSPCTHTDINHRRCRCPKWIQGTLPDGR